MKVKLTITLTDEEYKNVQTIPDLEKYVIDVIVNETEVPNYSHKLIWDLDINTRTIETKWEEPIPYET